LLLIRGGFRPAAKLKVGASYFLVVDTSTGKSVSRSVLLLAAFKKVQSLSIET
jgi:hypothetical protein